jgi:hypothetical protein
MDEHRVGLKPILRRVWAPIGQQPIVKIQPRYQWTYIYSFVQPATGRSFWLLMPTVSVEAFSSALNCFAKFVQASDKCHIDLVLDNAGWHSSPLVDWPTGIRPDFLPPYSPELQPVERLWQFSDQPLFNRIFTSLAALEQTLADHLARLQDQFDLIRSATHFHWWSRDC